MLGQYLIAFREFFEAALITSIVLAYLNRTARNFLSRYVWIGVLSSIVFSILIGIYILIMYGSLPESSRALFEGIASMVAVIVLSTMIYWMATKGKTIKSEVERKVEDIASQGTSLGLITFAFIVVFREGIETVLFLTPFLVREPYSTLTGMFLGILSGLILSYVIFTVGMKIDIRKFFYFTSILLVLLAGGLAGYGVHELIEYTGSESWGWLGKQAYTLNISKNNPLHHKGIVGSIFAVMFGYTVSAEWGRAMIHILYLAVALPLVFLVYKRV